MEINDKSLQDRAIDIKGKDYVLVKDRILYFNETYPNGSIVTEIVSNDEKRVIVKAIVTPDMANPTRQFIDYSQAERGKWIMGGVALEVASTSSVWRALAYLWIWVIDAIASADEINKAENTAKSLNKLPEFTNKNLEQLNMDKVQTYKSAEELISKISEKFSVSEEMKATIKEIRNTASQLISK